MEKLRSWIVSFERSNGTSGKDIFSGCNKQEAISDFRDCYRHDTYKVLSVCELSLFERCKKRYNKLMGFLCREYLEIGTRYSEGTENWNIRDMVAEADCQLSNYYEGGTCVSDMKEDNYSQWLSETNKLKRFIAYWLPYSVDIKAFEGHCSRYDNRGNEK